MIGGGATAAAFEARAKRLSYYNNAAGGMTVVPFVPLPPPVAGSAGRHAASSSSSSFAYDSVAHHQRLVKLATAFAIYDQNPLSATTVPAYFVPSVGSDCSYLDRHIERLFTIGVGYFVLFLSNTEQHPRPMAIGRSLAKAFPGRFLFIRGAGVVGAAAAWNRCLRLFFHDNKYPVPFVIIANMDFLPTVRSLKGFLRYTWRIILGGRRGTPQRNDGREEDEWEAPGRRDYAYGGTAPTAGGHSIIKYSHYSFFAYTYAAWRQLGYFDASVFPAYGEDVEMVYRAASLSLTFDDFNAPDNAFAHA